MLENLQAEKAQYMTIQRIRPLLKECIPLEQALGRIVAEDIISTQDMPPCPEAAMDGYAVTGSEDGVYQVIGHMRPGGMPVLSLNSGQAVGVVTGGTLPEGTKAVILEEAVELNGDSFKYNKSIEPGANMKPIGENFLKGDLLVSKGARFSPGRASVLSSLGLSEVTVYKKPLVAILSLGADVVSCQEEPVPGQMRNSNGVLVAGLVERELGKVVAVEAIGAKSSEQMASRIEDMLEHYNIVLTIGGAAYGAGDQAFELVKESSAEVLFWGMNIKPGSHSGVAFAGDYFRVRQSMVIALPGNPLACAVSFNLLVVPVLRAMQDLEPYQPRVTAVCTNAFEKKGGQRRFLLAHAAYGQNGWEVTILPGQKSSMTTAFLGGWNALIDLPAGHSPVAEGSEVSVILVDTCFLDMLA